MIYHFHLVRPTPLDRVRIQKTTNEYLVYDIENERLLGYLDSKRKLGILPDP